MNDLNFKIKVSDKMTQNKEDSYIRLSSTLRNQLNVEVGTKIPFTNTQNETVFLCVEKLYNEDADSDDFCYISEVTFKKINIESTLKIDNLNITLGCDPELFIVNRDNKRILKAYLFLKHDGEIGSDGMVAELRPPPGKNSTEVTANLYKLILQFREILDKNKIYMPSKLMMYAASSHTDLTAGFHVHHGHLPDRIIDPEYFHTVPVIEQVVRVMDYFVGVPAIIAEGTTDSYRRTNTAVSYGKSGDYRTDNRTLEYRVPGGILLKHPVLTQGILALSSVVIRDIISKIKLISSDFKFNYWASNTSQINSLYSTLPNPITVSKIISSKYVNNAKQRVKGIRETVSNMINFKEEEDAINNFFDCLPTSQCIDNDIEKNWINYFN